MRVRLLPFVFLWFLSIPVLGKEGVGRPNLVILLADDLGINDLASYGRAGHHTPHIDQLALEGKRFTNAYAQPLCSPSRAALLTGMHPARLQITTYLPGRPDWQGHKLLQPPSPAGLATDRTTLAERLRDSGYVTGFVGKWHLGEKPPFNPALRGFESLPGTKNGGSGEKGGVKTGGGGDKGEAGQAERALGFLEANARNPFFLYVAFDSPHVPLSAVGSRVEANASAYHPVYAAMVEAMDEAVGRIVAKIDALGLRENTLVVFASDNGGLHVPEAKDTPPTHNTPFRGGKGMLYEGGIRDPLIVRWPGSVRPGVEEVPVALGDLTPTFLDLAGATAGEPLDFVSLKGVLLGSGKLADRALYWHMPNYSNQGGRPGGAIREGDWKLLEHFEDGRLELFNLSSDAKERVDLAEAEPARVAAMRGKLEAWRRGVGASMPKANPGFDPRIWEACYQSVDVTRIEARGSSAESAVVLKDWRLAMDGVWARKPGSPGGGGFVMLEAANGEVHGARLIYEADPVKDTIGRWSDPLDWVSWDCRVPASGRYAVEVLQGCGKGHGGSVVEVRIGEAAVQFEVEETGHFQRFVSRRVGVLDLAAGAASLSVRAVTKKGGAVMDLRRVTLVRVP